MQRVDVAIIGAGDWNTVLCSLISINDYGQDGTA